MAITRRSKQDRDWNGLERTEYCMGTDIVTLTVRGTGLKNSEETKKTRFVGITMTNGNSI
jgi:hypothetical protein